MHPSLKYAGAVQTGVGLAAVPMAEVIELARINLSEASKSLDISNEKERDAAQALIDAGDSLRAFERDLERFADQMSVAVAKLHELNGSPAIVRIPPKTT